MIRDYLKVIPLGGVGTFGANATVVQTPKTSILIDFGLMFPPDHRQPGVEYYVHDVELLLQNFPDLSALLVTHGHEDHIGGIPFLVEKKPIPIYSMPYTAELIRQKLQDFRLKTPIAHVNLDHPLVLGDLEIEFIGVTHSIPQACAMAVSAPAGCLVHSGDFKVDALPNDNYPFQSQKLKRIGDRGVDLLIVDSTNAAKSGFCPSDAVIQGSLENEILAAPGRVFFTTFSSHIPRLRQLARIARRTGRKIAIMGRSFLKHYMTSLDTRYQAHDAELFISVKAAEQLPDREKIFVVTGSQGEKSSVLVRLKEETFQGLDLKQGDTVIFSSRTIPGNERVIALLISDLENRGVRVVSGANGAVHTSGHGYREDSAYMLHLVRPKTVIPIHGEFHNLLCHQQWLESMVQDGQQVMLIQNGDIVTVRPDGVFLTGQAPASLVPIDGNLELCLTKKALRDRKDMMYSGLLLVVAAFGENADRGAFQVRFHGLAGPDPDEPASSMKVALDAQRFGSWDDLHHLAERIIKEIRRLLKREGLGRPLIKLVLNGRVMR